MIMHFQDENMPKCTWRKAQYIAWLDKNGHYYPPKAYVKDLWKICQSEVKDNPNYHVDRIIREAGHIPLRIPPYHCALNPIEKI